MAKTLKEELQEKLNDICSILDFMVEDGDITEQQDEQIIDLIIAIDSIIKQNS